MPNPTFYDAFESLHLDSIEAAKPWFRATSLAVSLGPRVICDDLMAAANPGGQVGPVVHPRAYLWMEWPDEHLPGHRVGVAAFSMRGIHGARARLRSDLESFGATTSLSFVFSTFEVATGAVAPLGLSGGLWAMVWTNDEGYVLHHQMGGVTPDEVVEPGAQRLFATRYLNSAVGVIALMGLPGHRLVDYVDAHGSPYATVAEPGVAYGDDGMATA